MDYKIRDHTTNYVVGFLFDLNKLDVVLIEKLKPAFQYKKLNGIGGAIENNETPLEAMKREFFEEAGKEIDDWIQFCEMTLKGDNKIYFFKAFIENFYGIYSKTAEKVLVFEVDTIDVLNVLPNVKWLIPLALDKDNVTAQVIDLS